MTSQRIWKEIKEWVSMLILALIVGSLLHAYVFALTRVSGESMENTLHNGQLLLVSRIAHDFHRMPDYGEIVIIDSRVQRPRGVLDGVKEAFMDYVAFFNKKYVSRSFWVKRVIGKPGDIIEFRDGKMWRNGEVLQEPYVKEPMKPGPDRMIVVPQDTVFVMGDNRNHSADSRYIGPVPLDHVVGNVVYTFPQW